MLLLTITNRIELIHFLWTHDITGKPFYSQFACGREEDEQSSGGVLKHGCPAHRLILNGISYKTKPTWRPGAKWEGLGSQDVACHHQRHRTHTCPPSSSSHMTGQFLIVVSELIPSLQRELRTLTQIGWYSNDINAYMHSVCVECNTLLVKSLGTFTKFVFDENVLNSLIYSFFS